MTTEEQYNEAVGEWEAAQKQVQRLEARNAELEAVLKAAKNLPEHHRSNELRRVLAATEPPTENDVLPQS